MQRDLQTISQERDEDMGFDPVLVLMEDRPYRQIAFQVFERLFHRNELGTLRRHCPCCGGVTLAAIPASLQDGSPFSINIVALAIYLRFTHASVTAA